MAPPKAPRARPAMKRSQPLDADVDDIEEPKPKRAAKKLQPDIRKLFKSPVPEPPKEGTAEVEDTAIDSTPSTGSGAAAEPPHDL
eukprot:11683544-Alexandrium_andersonii.AAC.1